MCRSLITTLDATTIISHEQRKIVHRGSSFCRWREPRTCVVVHINSFIPSSASVTWYAYPSQNMTWRFDRVLVAQIVYLMHCWTSFLFIVHLDGQPMYNVCLNKCLPMYVPHFKEHSIDGLITITYTLRVNQSQEEKNPFFFLHKSLYLMVLYSSSICVTNWAKR